MVQGSGSRMSYLPALISRLNWIEGFFTLSSRVNHIDNGLGTSPMRVFAWDDNDHDNDIVGDGMHVYHWRCSHETSLK